MPVYPPMIAPTWKGTRASYGGSVPAGVNITVNTAKWDSSQPGDPQQAGVALAQSYQAQIQAAIQLWRAAYEGSIVKFISFFQFLDQDANISYTNNHGMESIVIEVSPTNTSTSSSITPHIICPFVAMDQGGASSGSSTPLWELTCNIYYSKDGKSWKIVKTFPNMYSSQLLAGPSAASPTGFLFLAAVSLDGVDLVPSQWLISYDGQIWKNTKGPPSDNISLTAWDRKYRQFVAMEGDSGPIYASTDGINWVVANNRPPILIDLQAYPYFVGSAWAGFGGNTTSYVQCYGFSDVLGSWAGWSSRLYHSPTDFGTALPMLGQTVSNFNVGPDVSFHDWPAVVALPGWPAAPFADLEYFMAFLAFHWLAGSNQIAAFTGATLRAGGNGIIMGGQIRIGAETENVHGFVEPGFANIAAFAAWDGAAWSPVQSFPQTTPIVLMATPTMMIQSDAPGVLLTNQWWQPSRLNDTVIWNVA